MILAWKIGWTPRPTPTTSMFLGTPLCQPICRLLIYQRCLSSGWCSKKESSVATFARSRFQEVVPLNARTVLGPKQRRAAMKWNLLIGDALNNRRHGDGAAAMHDQGGQGGLFRCLMSKQMVGIFVSVWTRSSLRRHVRHPAVSSVGTGVLGRLGNKVRYIEAESHTRTHGTPEACMRMTRRACGALRRARCPSGSCFTARASASSAATWPQAARTATRYAGTLTPRASSPGPASSAPAARRQHRMSCPRRFLAMSRSPDRALNILLAAATENSR